MQEKLKILFFEITKKCNAHCDHCGSKCDINSEEGLDKKYFLNVLQDVHDNIGTDIMLNITGGEPLLRKDLFEIMDYAHKLGFEWGMVTNGTLITEDIIKDMKKTGMSTISISIDGMKDTHEKFRHLPGSFDKIIKNIILLQDSNFLEHIQVTFIANKKNIYELPALWRLLNNLNIDSMRISCIDPIGRAENNKELELDSKNYKYLFEFINNTNKKNELQCIWSCSHYFGNTEEPDVMGRKFVCPTGQIVASILANGDIFACPNIPRLPNLIQGNIKFDKFSKVWKNKFIPFRNRKLNEKCNNCDKKEFCNGDSFHTWDFENNTPKYCYKDMFFNDTIKSKNLNEYKKYLQKKYKNLQKTEILSGKQDRLKIIIEPEAFNDIKTYFHIGTNNPMSMYEQQMGLVGFNIDGIFVIKYAFASELKNRTRNMGYVNEDTIINATNETNIIKENFYLSDDKNDYISSLEFLGFIHSHPLDTEFCYSDGDYMFHQKMIKKMNTYIGILLNPNKNYLAAFYGNDCLQADLIILENSK